MNTFVLLAEGGGQIQEIARQFGVDWPHLIAQTISFCIVCVLLQRYAYRPVLKILQQRRQEIARGLADAEKAKAELASAEATKQDIIAKANAQGDKLIEEAHTAAARVQERETQKAVAAAKSIVTKAHEAAEQDHARMLGELKREVGRLVVQTTSTVAGKVLTTEDQRRLEQETSKALAE